MDFGDVVNRALQQNKASTGGPDADSSSSGSKHRPPPLSLLGVAGSTHPTSSGASPGAARTTSPAPPHPANGHSSTAPQTPTSSSPSRRSSFNPFTSHRGQSQAAQDGALAPPTVPSPPASSRSPSAARRGSHHPSPRHHHDDAEYLLPPPSITSGPPGREGLGLDTPRPKHKPQASFDWFGEAFQREAAAQREGMLNGTSGLAPGLPGYLSNGFGDSSSFGAANMRRSDSPARTDMSRTSTASTSLGGFAGIAPGPSSMGRKVKSQQKRSSGDALTEESEWEDDGRTPPSPARASSNLPSSHPLAQPFRSNPIGYSSGNSPATSAYPSRRGSLDMPPERRDDSPATGLRGAFTASDLERGARRLRGDEPEKSDSSGGARSPGSRDRFDWKRRASVLPASIRAGGKKRKSGDGDKLARTQSAGAAEGPGSGTETPRSPPQDGKARSVHAGVGGGPNEGDADWEDEVRDQFDANVVAPNAAAAAGGPSSPPANRPVPQGRRSSRWGSTSLFPHHRPTDSGASTPREQPASEDEREGGSGTPGAARRPGQAQRKGSAWGVVRDRLKVGEGKGKKKKEAQGASLTGHELISELTTGVLPLVLVKMAVMDRDERGDRRIPILMNYLKLRITDSVYPLHDKHAIFRIELEYGDGAVKWVIYRELKDFVNLHAHYRVANLRQGIDKFPTFPKTSLPYLNWLKSEKGGKGGVGKAEFAKAQRETLENYLLKLIKATMFGAGANRLCKFLEISAMSIMLTTRGGEQGKQGYLRITSSGASRKKQPGFHPLQWKKRHEPKWFIVRDSYIVSVDDPASTEIYDVIMVDSTFEIERPTRVLRKGLHLLGNGESDDDIDAAVREGAIDLLAAEAKPQGHRGAGDPNDPSSTRHKPMGGAGGKGAGAGDNEGGKERVRDETATPDKEELKTSSVHTFYLRSSERKLRLVAKTERQQDQFIASIEKMLAKTIWAGRNRFDSFAPIRLNVAAQWLIDGRDYFWSLSRAIALAKHKIFIHDWWLSPELYLRRPPIENEKWRLDRLLQRKAREGVQVFVIVYKEVSNDFTPVESNYTKTRLRGLHPNIHVQRSPSHTSTGTLLWSHHEKMCVIDETIGFMGGLDLCFGRWDTPGHVLIDDGPNLLNESDPQNVDRDKAQESQIWPGKDYSNQRVLDFHTLSKPDEDMYDRGKVPRQPWHDIGLQIIGQPARDLCRHFIQRWNYLLRTKNHTVKMPFLLPAPDFTPQQLQELRITGTCEVQICRSVGPWSMGITHVEHSIQNAYIKAIQMSDHFVYIENQFFITSTEVEGTVIENKIGDALVSRMVRAHSEGTPWRCIVVVPTVPGYPYPLDHSDASSVRLIMECQYASICRGEKSIFARLRREGIDPDEYITFFGLRAWGKLSSGALTTESTYIHAKGMVVDDRIAIIGSANINERSQRGDRDSELACIIRDTDMIDSTMGGKPYKVGRFAHTMRVRLMREHLGIDVDELEAAEGRDELGAREQPSEKMQEKDEEWDPDHEQSHGTDRGAKPGKTFQFISSAVGSTKNYAGDAIRGTTEAATVGLEKGGNRLKANLNFAVDDAENKPPQALDDDEETNADKIVQGEKGTEGFASTVVPTLEEKMMAEGRPRGDAVEEGGISKLRSQQQREREEGPATHSPSQAREADEQANDPERVQDARNHQTKSSGPVDDQEEKAANRRLGDKVTQSSEIDDTRKLDMQDDRAIAPDKDAPPLSPIDEDGPSGKDGPQPTANYGPAPPSSDAAPPDIAKAHQGYREQGSSSAHDRSASEGSKASQQHATNQSKGNEQAVNRNAITGTLRRNLRERGAYTIPLSAPKIDPYGFTDPIVDSFYKDVWLAAAVRNTQIYRKVFRCMPDDLVQTWKQYREFQTWAERHNKAPKDVVPPGQDAPHSDPHGHSGQHGAGGGGSAGGVVGQGRDEPGETVQEENKRHPLAGSTAPGYGPGLPGGKEAHDYAHWAKGLAKDASGMKEKDVEGRDGINAGKEDGEEELERQSHGGTTITRRARSSTLAAMEEISMSGGSGAGGGGSEATGGEDKRRGRNRSGTTAGMGGSDKNGEKKPDGDHDDAFPEEEREQMEQLLEEVTGQLVVFPTRFLEAESAGGNFLFSKDRIPCIYD
ncbi:hypothetical protein JCM11641_001553 [Rhodosporidiobolus odoratus]